MKALLTVSQDEAGRRILKFECEIAEFEMLPMPPRLVSKVVKLGSGSRVSDWLLVLHVIFKTKEN